MCDAAETGNAVSAIMFDIDHFKTINDTYGHDMGDRVLAAVGGSRDADVVSGRLGGEEFCVLTMAALRTRWMRRRAAAIDPRAALRS